MYNSSEQKPYSSTQSSYIQLEVLDVDDTKLQSTNRLIQDLSDRISKTMFPLYDTFKSNSENGKVMGIYPVLKFPSAQQTKTNVKIYTESTPQTDSYGQPKINFQQLANRVQERQKLQQQAANERKIHQLLDQNQARQNMEDDSSEQQYGNPKTQFYKFKKAKRYYEKLAREMKSNKKLKRRFKDKNRPKKAKSAYNLFVEQVVPQIKAENPSFSAPDLVRVAAKMYNQLTEQEKIPYQRRYLVDKERFERERQAYFRQHPEMDYRMDAKQKATFMNGRYMDL